MNGSIERLRRLPRLLRLAATRPMVPAVMPTRRWRAALIRSQTSRNGIWRGDAAPGSGGRAVVLRRGSIRFSSRGATNARERGRVLYADGHGVRVTEQTARASRKQTCPSQRLVQGRTNPAPNS